MHQQPHLISRLQCHIIGLETPPAQPDDERWGLVVKALEKVAGVLPDAGFGVHILNNDLSERAYLTGLEITRLNGALPGLARFTLPPHLYAVFRHHGLAETVTATLGYVFEDWLPDSQYRLADNFYFEYYDDHYQPDEVDSEIFIFLPVQPR